jgi:CO dehydrogenase/acetyl-CoA synthase beta subunit
MQRQAIEQLLGMMPDEVHGFAGSAYPAPVRAALLGQKTLRLPTLRSELLAKQDGDVRDLLEPMLLAAEVVEAAQADKARYFITDLAAQSLVFTGSKWRAGWALVLGGDDQQELIEQLQARSFMVFTDLPGIADTHYIGSGPTSPIYFLQLMVRYGLIWGRIAPGNGHEMGHFLEDDMPGLIIINRDLPALKYLVALGLMKLGAPAVVSSSFPFPYGNRIVADTVAEILDRGSRFRNLRQRYFMDEVISLPAPCNPAFVHERMEPTQRLGGNPTSFFCVQPAAKAAATVAAKRHHAAGPGSIGISVIIDEEHFSDEIAYSVEKTALKAINYLPGVHAYEQRGALCLDLAVGVELSEEQVKEAIYWGIRLQYPRLKQITVHVVSDPEALAPMAGDVRAYKAWRERFVADMREDNTDEFCACTECRPFSLVHTCLLTPNRWPMCGSRTYASVKAGAYFGSAEVPWRRRSENDLPMRMVFSKGKLLDPLRGEYEGCNAVYQMLTSGKLQRVYLHSVRDYPVTSCGCFQALAFWLPEVEGIGIMLRKSGATTPDGCTWDMLANRAGGKQAPGIAGVSLQYMHSPDFLKGDGGIGNVVWVDSALYKKICRYFLQGQRVATEKDVRSMDELRRFVGR